MLSFRLSPSASLPLTAAVLLALTALFSPPVAAQSALRGWHADGQTFLVWTDDQTFSGLETYDVYVSSQPISKLTDGTLLGRLFPQDWQARRLTDVDAAATWRIPDGLGGSYQLAPDEALFVYTPHAAVDEHFAVVKHGSKRVDSTNSTGPIVQTLAPVQCHPQLSGTTALGYPFTVYAHWIDGRDDHESGRVDYPVMGNQHANGTAHLFTVFEPPGGLPPGPVPTLLQFHGGLGSHLGWLPGEADTVDNTLAEGLMLALDDVIYLARDVGGARPWPINTFWFGYWEDYDRFAVPAGYPPNGVLVVDYTLRRVAFIWDWVTGNLPVDPERVSAMGHSMGGGATSFVTRRFPDRFASGMSFEHAYGGMTSNAFMQYLLGTREQNLPTNLPGGLGFTDFMQVETDVAGVGDRSFARYIWGRNDDSVFWDWPGTGDVPATMAAIDAGRTGQFLYWDERTHTRAEWIGEHWDGSPRLSAEEMTRHRAGQSFPAITGVDHDPAAQTQPWPGNGDPLDGDPAGTWGGYFDWETDSIVDTADAWEATVFLIGGSSFANDDAPAATATADVTIRKAESFQPAPSTALTWTLRDDSSGSAAGDVLVFGSLVVPGDGVVTIAALTLTRDPLRRRIIVTIARDDDSDGVDAQLDCDDAAPDVWASPGETLDLQWSADQSTISWSAPADPGGAIAAVRYDAVRATDPSDLASGATCLASDIASTSIAADTESPGAGALYVYVVRAENPCGTGPAGTASNGGERPAPDCP